MTNQPRRYALTLVSLAAINSGLALAQDRFPRHTFSPNGRAVTEPSAAPKQEIAGKYVQNQALAAGLPLEDLAGLYLVKNYRTEHNGVQHLVYRQQFDGIDVWNSDFIVNIDADGRVINSGGQLYGRPIGSLKAPQIDSAVRSLDRALARLHSKRAGAYKATRHTRDPILRTFRFVRDGAPSDAIDGDPMWYPVNGTLHPVWMFYIQDDNGVDRWATPVDSESGFVLPKQNLTWFQQARVYDKPSPQPNTTPGMLSPVIRPYVARTMQPLTGDPKASPIGWVSGNFTAGNNVVAAPNPNGITFNVASKPIAGSASGVFDFPLDLGPGFSNPALFPEAEVTNLFYWTNLAHDSFYSIGFDEQAGAYQSDNFGRGGVDGDPMYAFSQFGSQGTSFASLNNAFYTTTRSNEDGSQGSINMYVGGSGPYRIFADGSYDAEVITHEYTHGVSSRIIRGLGTQQGGSMGEAWSDFYSLEFTLPMGVPADGAYTEGDYLFQNFGVGIRTRPYTTDMKLNPLTFAQFGSVTSYPEVHADGEIWMEALWDVRANLIEQFGENEGRRRVRMIVLDGMKLSPPSPTMIDMRDAILLADQVDFKGASQTQIWKAFAKRGMGALAYSIDPNSTFIAPSFDLPSSRGQMRFYQDEQLTGETLRIILQDTNLTGANVTVQVTSNSGDLEDLRLRKVGGIYYGTMGTTTANTRQRNNVVTALAGDDINVYYNDSDTGDGTAAQTFATVHVRQNYTQAIYGTSYPRYTFNKETRIFGFPDTWDAARVEFPFDFPFYGKKYRRAWISTDGIISFGTPEFLTSPCPSHTTLGASPAIAPAFLNLRIGSDPTQDVFISTGIDFVTFHWVGTTQPYQYLFESFPVDFNATLFNDGRILFQFGAGNQQMIADHLLSSAYGCDGGGPVSGISPGHAAYPLTSFYADGFTNLQNATTTGWFAPYNNSSVPVAVLESPAAGSSIKDVLTVSGVAGDTVGVIGIDILIDGMMRGTTNINGQRPDFCASQRIPNCPFVGFTTDLNLSANPLSPGTHSIQLHARNYQGGITIFPDQPVTFNVDGTPSRLPVGKIEAPLDGDSVTGIIPVIGYVYALDLRISSVTILVDGLSYAPAALLSSRTDVCSALPAPAPPNCPRIGFLVTLNTASTGIWLPNGAHKMQLRVQDSLGRITVLPDTPVNFTVTNPDRAPSSGVLETPALGDTLSGIIDLKGFAYAPGGRVTSTVVLLDGSAVGTLAYGGSRTDACASLPDVTACPNIGFTGTLDTRRFPNGPHVLGVGITNATGTGTVIPALARNGMSVIIQN